MGYCVSRFLPSEEARCKEYYLDNGFEDLPPIYNQKDISRGSVAIDIITGDQWYLNSKWEWEVVYEEEIISGTVDVPEYPTLTYPSVTCKYIGESSDLYLINLGESATITVEANFDRGTIEPDYGTEGFRSGLPTGYIYSVDTVVLSQSSSELTDTAIITYTPTTEATYQLSCSVAYGAGEQPYDSNGDLYGDPLPSGTVSDNTLSVQAIYPVLAGLSSDVSLAIAPITDDSTITERFIDFEAEPVASINQTFGIPATQTLVGIKMIDLGGTWNWVTGTAATSLRTFQETTEIKTLTIDGEEVEVEYKIYANAYSKNGARTIMLVLE